MDRLWAGWRSEYVARSDAHEVHKDAPHGCVFCGLLGSDRPDSETNVVWRNDKVAALLNAYPYGTGHVLILPLRHVANLRDLDAEESASLWQAINDAATAIEAAYHPDGMNIGFNLGRGSGAGIPEHLHAHVLPRWHADTNFITAIANVKVLPEPLDVTWTRLTQSWPRSS